MATLPHYFADGYVYHLTSSTDYRRPIFRSIEAATILLEAIEFQRRDRAVVLAYVVMPDHFHLLLQPRNLWTPSRIIQSVKGYSSRLVSQRHGPGGRIWEHGYCDRVIRRERQLAACMDYIHANPVKAGLCTEADCWPYSSAYQGRSTDIDTFVNG